MKRFGDLRIDTDQGDGISLPSGGQHHVAVQQFH